MHAWLNFITIGIMFRLPGYHWDCSDWVMQEENNTKPIANILEVSVNEICDSESISDNNQIELLADDEVRQNGMKLPDGCTERSAMISLNDIDLNDIDYVDDSQPSSPCKYAALHPNDYLPRHTSASMEGERVFKKGATAEQTNHKKKGISNGHAENDDVSVSILDFDGEDDEHDGNICEIEDSEFEYDSDSRRQSTFV